MWCSWVGSWSCFVQGLELDFIDSCVSFPTQDIMLFTCRVVFPLTSDSIEWLSRVLCIVFALEQELCYLFLACFLQVPDLLLMTCSVDCTVLETTVILHSETKGRANFPVVLVLHHSNMSTLLPAAGTKLRFGFCLNLKMVTLMFEGSLLSDFPKAIWFMASSTTDSNRAL